MASASTGAPDVSIESQSGLTAWLWPKTPHAEPLHLCPDPSCDGHDAWPPDLDIDRRADMAVVLKFKPLILSGFPCEGNPDYDSRFDFNASGCIDKADVLQHKPVILTSCTP